MLKTQLILKNIITPDDWEIMSEHIQYDFLYDNHFAELKEAELFTERLNMVAIAEPYIGKYFSQDYVRRKVLRQTDEEIIEQDKLIDKEILDEQGFYPRRARITMIKAQTCSITHRDYPWSSDNLDDGYMCRVHVPIITNEKCTHWAERKEYHMPADGSVYILPVNNQHQIRNNSNIDRYHLIVDVYDTRGISKTMKFHDTIQKLETSAQDYRKEIDKTTVTVFHQLLFEFGKLRYKFASKL
jgi:hypothetical protein